MWAHAKAALKYQNFGGPCQIKLFQMSLFQALSDDLSEEHITMIFNNLDTDNSQSIDLEEFMVS